jgi:hypothetical protein
MRNRFLHIVSALVLLVLFSCRKEVSTEGHGNASVFTVQIDGDQWTAVDSLKQATILAGIINLTGVSADDKQLSITLNDSIPGVYTLDQTTTSAASYASVDSADLYAYTTNQGNGTQAGGTVTVIEIDQINHTITGTFSLNVYRDFDGKQKKLTDGVFYKLPYSSTLSEANKGDTIKAVLDGQNWAGRSIIASALSNSLVISGSALNGTQTVSLFMPVDAPVGDHPLNFFSLDYSAVYAPVLNTAYFASTGNLTILENNPVTRRIRGNFNFTASDGSGQQTYEVTNGYFSVQYQ